MPVSTSSLSGFTAAAFWSTLGKMDRFALGEVTLELVQGDITESDTVAIANAANAMLVGGGGVDGAIHRAAGPELMDALREVKATLPSGVLETGGAVITKGFRLAADHVIHCVGPIYDRERDRAPSLLESCYRRALELCREHSIRSIAFPSISTGVYGYPLHEAAPIALRTVHDEGVAGTSPGLIRFVLFDESTFVAYRTAAKSL